MKNMKVLFLLGAVLLLSIAALAVGASSGGNFTAYIPVSMKFDCLNWPTGTPAGALPGQPPPVFCMINNNGPSTDQPGANSWADDFNHGLSFATFEGTDYQIYNEIGAWRTIYWRHADHWMVDMAPHPQNTTYGYDRGLSMMRPNQSFKFENGTFVVETTVAAGHEGYDEKAWPEIIISNGSQPYDDVINLYGYDQFPDHWTIGCRLQSSRIPICALKNDAGTAPGGSAQIWEMSFWQQVGTYSYGGFPSPELEGYWNVCQVTDPDTVCRDHFRLELTATSLKLYVNGGLYFEQSGIPTLPNELLTGDLYVYLASTQVNHPADTIRYHWDNFNVNPSSTAEKQAQLFSPADTKACSIPSNETLDAGLSLKKSLQRNM